MDNFDLPVCLLGEAQPKAAPTSFDLPSYLFGQQRGGYPGRKVYSGSRHTIFATDPGFSVYEKGRHSADFSSWRAAVAFVIVQREERRYFGRCLA